MSQTEIEVVAEGVIGETEHGDLVYATVPEMQLPDVNTLLAAAVEQGEGGVAALERLVDLQERMLSLQAENALSAALAGFKEDCPQIPRTATGRVMKGGSVLYEFKFSPLDTIDRTARPHLKRWGLSYYFDSHFEAGVMHVKCTVRHALGATVSASFAGPTASKSGTSELQKTGAAHSYCKRQALSSALGLVTTSADEDAMPDAADLEPVDQKLVAELRKLIDNTSSDIDKLLAYAGVDSLAKVNKVQYEMLKRQLEAKAAAQERKP